MPRSKHRKDRPAFKSPMKQPTRAQLSRAKDEEIVRLFKMAGEKHQLASHYAHQVYIMRHVLELVQSGAEAGTLIAGALALPAPKVEVSDADHLIVMREVHKQGCMVGMTDEQREAFEAAFDAEVERLAAEQDAESRAVVGEFLHAAAEGSLEPQSAGELVEVAPGLHTVE